MKNKPLVAIMMGSDSDLEIMAEAAKVFEEFGVEYSMVVASAHRSPDFVHAHVHDMQAGGVKVFMAGAGGAAHLAGVVASLTTLPVIGVPVKAKTLDGLDSLLSTVQMPPGIPVATIGINAARNAGLLAIQILGTSDKAIEEKLIAFKKKMADDIQKKGERLMEIGYQKYLEK